ncbi:MAG TPA: flavin reductase family protein [Steroidobacteraceae bacterium]|nr:flavin reductase family protein [Steroidobacteraceae bacterium]
MAANLDSFKLGMRRLAAGVCLITTRCTDGTRRGMTATAVCSVSASPPTLLCCINRSNSSYDAILASGIFAVNVLSLEDRPLADLFARSVPPEEKFAAGLWQHQDTGAPLLESALAAFDCRVGQHVAVGTHGILFGEIQAVQVRQVSAKPLLYVHGAYGGFASIAQASDLESLWIPNWDYEPN